MDCFGTYFTHVQTCNCTRVLSATEWTASVHTLHMSFFSWSDSWQSMGEVPAWISATSATLHRNPLVCCWSCCRKHESRVVIWRRGSMIKCSIPPRNSKFVGFLWSVAEIYKYCTKISSNFQPIYTCSRCPDMKGVEEKGDHCVCVRNQMNLVRGACINVAHYPLKTSAPASPWSYTVACLALAPQADLRGGQVFGLVLRQTCHGLLDEASVNRIRISK